MRAAQRPSAALHFRGQIEKAEAAGFLREDMSLHLTLNDVNQLKRDRTLPITDISFAEGVMRYLGVKIVQGGVAVSILREAPDPHHP